MARIKSTIEFFEGVPIPTDFKHEPLFETKEEQKQFFEKYKRKDLTFSGSYQRVEEQIRTKFRYDQLKNINYVHVINPSHVESDEKECEWWGFVMDIHYINDGLVTVDWVVDPIQTFMFKWDLNSAYIERGMANLVKKSGEGDSFKVELDEEQISCLLNSEPVGVDGLAYAAEVYDVAYENNTSNTSYLVLVVADSNDISFVGVPSQISYYVLPFDKKLGILRDFEIKNVVHGIEKVTIKSTKNKNVWLSEAIKSIAKDQKLLKGSGALKTAYVTSEMGFNFKATEDRTKLVTTLSDGEILMSDKANIEIYQIGGNDDNSSGNSGGNNGGGTSGVPDDMKEFLKLPINTNFNVNESKFLSSVKKAPRVQNRLGGSEENIKKVIDIVKKNGISPEIFFAYEIQEGWHPSLGWLNHTNYTGDPYSDAESVSKWAVSAANTTGHVELAWYDMMYPYYTTPLDKQKAGQEFADSLEKGAIGRMYLSGTAAATWAAFDPNGLKKEYNQVQDYANPIQGCMDLLKSWK